MSFPLSLWLVTALLFQPQAANPSQTEPVYVTATVRERAVSSATAAVTIIDFQTIEASGAQTLGDLLRLAPGVYVESDGARGGFTVARMRGGDPNFSNIQINGVPVNDLTYQAGGAFNLSGLPLAGVTRIEVVRGPLSSFYGSTGLGGVINIITSPSGERQLKLEISAGGGNHGGLNLTHAGEIGKGLYSLGFSAEQEKELIARERFESRGVFANLNLPTGQGVLKLNAGFTHWEADDYADASGGPLAGSGELRISTHRDWRLGAVFTFGQQWRQQLELGWYQHDLDRQNPAVGQLVPSSQEDTQFSKTRLAWTMNRNWNNRWESDFGLDSIREDGDNSSLLNLPPFLGGDVAGNYQLDRAVHGAFAELRYHGRQWLLEAAMRMDEPDEREAEFNPRLGFSYGPATSRLRGSVGRAFKLPGFFATAGPPALGGNPLLQPETSTGADLGWSHQGRDRNLDITIFANRFKSLVDFDFEQFLHVNRAEVEAFGLEISGSLAIHNLNLQVAVTGQDVSVPDSETALRHRPKWSGSFRADYQVGELFSVQLDGRAQTRVNDQQVPVTDRFQTPGYAVFGLGAAYKPTPAWRLTARIENLADRRYETLIGFPGAERNYRLKLQYTR